VSLGELSSNRHYSKKDCKEKKEQHNYKNGTWNVRTLNRESKLENMKKEMQKNEVSVLGVSEVRWKGQGEIRIGDYTVYHSGCERAEKVVAIVVHKSVVRSVVKKIVYNDRIIAIKLQAEPIHILMIQVYMPASEHEDDEVEELYGITEEILKKDGKGDTNTIIMGDWNSVVGDEPYRNIVGQHGLERKNHGGQMLINLCERSGLIVNNTWFRKPKRRLYTWKAPGDRSRHQLDYILVKHRFRNGVNDVQTLPGVDTDSDHNLLVAKICTRLKKIMIPKEKTAIGFGEVICSATKSAGYSRRESRCNWM
jgi:exonuclease III